MVVTNIYSINEQSSVVGLIGASGGIGLAITSALASAGRTVAAVARRAAMSDELVRIESVIPICQDVTDFVVVAELAATIESEIGPIDLVMNNAGIMGGGGTTWSPGPESYWRVPILHDRSER